MNNIHRSSLTSFTFLGLFVLACQAWPKLPADRPRRFVAFDPPKIIPEAETQTVKAGESYRFRCESSRRGVGVSWRLPEDSTDDLRNRITLIHDVERQLGQLTHVSELTISQLSYLDTGTYVCTYNGTRDTSSIENASRVHLYVDDEEHLLKHTNVEFLQFEQRSTSILPCVPTHPDVNVTLIREGQGPVEMDRVVSFDPKVGFRISPVTFEQHSGQFRCVATPSAHSARLKPQSRSIFVKVLSQTDYLPPPFINRTLSRHVSLGDSFELICSVTLNANVLVELSWTTPNTKAMDSGRLLASEQTARNLSLGSTHLVIVERSLKIRDATMDDQGSYECKVTDHSGKTEKRSDFVRIHQQQEPFLIVYYDGYQTIEVELDKDGKLRDNTEDSTTAFGSSPNKVQWVVQIKSHPKPTVQWYGPKGPISNLNYPSSSRDIIVRSKLDRENAHTVLSIEKVTLDSAGTYKCVVTNGDIVKEETFVLKVTAPPSVQASVRNSKPFYQKGQEYAVKCSATGSPIPEISWIFKPCSSYTDCHNNRTRTLSAILESKPTHFRRDSEVRIVASQSGQVICQGCNYISSYNHAGCTYEKVFFFVSDVENGFDVSGPRKVLEGEHIKLRCTGSVSNPDDLTWYKHTVNGDLELDDTTNVQSNYKILTTSTKLSYSKELLFKNVSLLDRGRYTCKGKLPLNPEEPIKASYKQEALNSRYYNDASFNSGSRAMTSKAGQRDGRFDNRELSLDLTVLPLEAPTLDRTNLDSNRRRVIEKPEDGLRLECKFAGRPQPQTRWTLNGNPVVPTKNTTRVQIVGEHGSLLRISYLTPSYEGLYECFGSNPVGEVKSHQVVRLRSSLDNETLYANISYPVIMAVVVSLILVLILLILAKLCYSRHMCCSRRGGCCRRKAPPSTPPTPRLKQYEMPFDQTVDNDPDDMDLDECRMTLTSGRDGSISPHYRHGTPHPHPQPRVPCQCHSSHFTNPSCQYSFAMSKCSLCDVFHNSSQTLPRMMMMHRLDQPSPSHSATATTSPYAACATMARTHGPMAGFRPLVPQQDLPADQAETNSVGAPRLSAEF